MAQKKNRKATPTSQPLNAVEEEGAFFGFDAHIIRNLVDNDGIAVSDWKEVDYLGNVFRQIVLMKRYIHTKDARCLKFKSLSKYVFNFFSQKFRRLIG